jgi:ubiquinone/menaquinone biosynthesis C-methylase UbiE
MSDKTTPVQDLRPYYDAIWNEYLEGRDLQAEIGLHRTERPRFYRLIERCIARIGRKSASMLEIGSGTAIDSYILAEDTDAEIVGVDISFPSLLVAARCGQYFKRPIALAAGDAEHLPFSDHSFDIVFSQGVVEHFRDPSAMLREQIRVLKPDGVLVINVPQRRTGYTRYKRREMARGTWPWGWETEYSPGELRRLGKQHGMKAIDVVGYDHWGSRRGTLYWRHMHTRLQKRNPWRHRQPFPALESLYDAMWTRLEERWGPYFLINVTMAFVRECRG